jgi:hypothetical protein
MDCQGFDILLDDLARNVSIDLAIRRRGLEHAQNCQECRMRLAEAQSLSAGLRALAAADASRQAPLQLEGALLNAFEEHMRIDSEARAVRLFSWAGRRWQAIAAAAAVVALGLGVALHHGRSGPRGAGLRQAAVSAPLTAGAGQQHSHSTSASERRPTVEQRASRRPDKRSQSRSKTQRPASHMVWAADFLPLPYADNAGPLGDARIVRLTLPNSALASLGLPVSEESVPTDITADVLVGEDGIPRAISFVPL